MSDKLNRLAKLPGSKTTKKAEELKIDGFNELLGKLQQMTELQVQSNENLSKALRELTAVVMKKQAEGMKVDGIIAAIEKLAESQVRPMPPDYQIDFERDRNHLMKSGIRLTAIKPRLN